MATHSSVLAWRIPWTEAPGGLQSMGCKESDMTERLHFDFSVSCIGEGNGNPLQCSCLEKTRDGAAWWAAVYAVAQSQTRLKRLSSSRHESAVGVHVSPILNPPPSPSHPSGSSQCSPEHPVSCIEPELVIHFTYGNIHVSMLFSQIIRH